MLILQHLVLGIRSSVGTLALPLSPLYSNISLLSFLLFLRDSHLIVQECQSYSQFHNCNFLSQIWQRAFAHFLILPGELHLGAPKPNCHNPGLGAPILYKLPLLPPGGKNMSFSSGIQGNRSVSLSADIAYMCIPSQITCNCYSKVFNAFQHFQGQFPQRYMKYGST